MRSLKVLLLMSIFIFQNVTCKSGTGSPLVFEWKTKDSDFTQQRAVYMKSFTTAYKEIDPAASISGIGFDNEVVRFQDSELSVYALSVSKDDKCIGVVFVHYSKQIKNIYIAQFAVTPSEWGKGIGSELISRVQKRFDPKTMTVISRCTNRAACQFYKKLKFASVELSEKEISDGFEQGRYCGFKWEGV